jgi:penicillin-binding protein 1B
MLRGPRKTTRRAPARGRPRPAARRRWLATGLKVFVALAVAFAAYLVYLDARIRVQFEGKRWSLPAHVYARPLELYAGMTLRPEELQSELLALGYRQRGEPAGPGEFSRRGDRLRVYTREFRFWDGMEPPHRFQASFADGRLARVENGSDRPVRIEPLRIGGIYPAHHEDRVLVQLEDVPPLLVAGLLATEDRDFYRHHGISPRAIGRALLANLRAASVVQGGSTLTQQLVKNYFLSNERSLWRKAQEALMAFLLELHYSKAEILEAYLNEVYLGQDGPRAIHGFGLASRFYFARSLDELRPSQIALLVALVRGASHYNPRRYPERARKRRDRVLDTLVAQGRLDADSGAKAKQEGLGVTPRPPGGSTRYPAFMELVRRQLRRDYRDEDLSSEGLRIFTTLSPRVQGRAERALSQRATRLEKTKRLPPGSLEGAVLVTTREGGEVLALVGGREARFAGFNRALDAVRPVGSLIKPAVYLTALTSGEYTLATPLQDTTLRVRGPDGKVWAPQNHDHRTHGSVPFYLALAESYNLATARLGFSVGLRQVLNTLRKLGVERTVPAYPAVFLGAVNLSPFDVTQMYQTLAAGGFRTPLRTIREVSRADGEPLARYPLTVEQVVPPAEAYLITAALQQVIARGTGSALARRLPGGLTPAGKTGTTDDLRDSWFAGYTGDYLAVAWLGRDDNQPAGLSGSAGAMQVWADIMEGLGPRPLRPVPPPDVAYAWIDSTGRLSGEGCEGATALPFREGTLPVERSECAGSSSPDPVEKVVNWFKDLLR